MVGCLAGWCCFFGVGLVCLFCISVFVLFGVLLLMLGTWLL